MLVIYVLKFLLHIFPNAWIEKLKYELVLQTYVVGTLSDLFNIKPCQVTIIFVDSNDRDIILENQETDIGDIRRKTTECLTKINCKSYKRFVY